MVDNVDAKRSLAAAPPKIGGDCQEEEEEDFTRSVAWKLIPF